MSENKIKYGLKNVFYALATIAADGTATFSTPVAFPGAVSLTLDPQGDNTVFHADNMEYWVGNGNNGYSGTLEMARITDGFREEVINETKDSKGVLIEDQNAEIKHFALLFQFEGDVKATRHVMYNCTCGRPSAAGNTKENTTTPQTESVPITSSSIYNNALQKNIVKASTTATTDSTTYEGWNEAVYLPTALPAAG